MSASGKAPGIMLKTPALVLMLAMLLSACSLAPRYDRPEQEMPKQWRAVDMGSAPLHTDWWNRFNDPVLSELVEEALKNNQDLAESMAKIESAAAQVGVGTAALMPVINGTGSAAAQGASEKSANTVPFDQSKMSRSTTAYQGALSASWELDFWGRSEELV